MNSMVYRDEIPLRPLKDFWEDSIEDLEEPNVVEDNAPIHKEVSVRQELEMTCHGILQIHLIRLKGLFTSVWSSLR